MSSDDFRLLEVDSDEEEGVRIYAYLGSSSTFRRYMATNIFYLVVQVLMTKLAVIVMMSSNVLKT